MTKVLERETPDMNGKLLLRTVTPVPPVEGLPKGPVDVLVGETGAVERVGRGIDPEGACEVVDLRGTFVSPGWVDLHTHIYFGATDISVRPSDAGRATGVITMVDAGSAGEANFRGFSEFIVSGYGEQVFAFLNIGSIGLVACNRISELQGMASVDLERSLRCIAANRHLIKGVKVRASHVILGGWGLTPVTLAKKLSRISGLPLMVHVGEPPPLLEEVLDILDPGDIVTHCFHGKTGGNLLEDPRAFKAALRAAERGVRFDIGHGSASFSFAVARYAIEAGLVPYSISTDLHAHNIDGPVYDLATTMSKLFNLGLSLETVIRSVTFNPARALGLAQEESRWLSPGTQASLTLFRVLQADLWAPDSLGNRWHLKSFIEPVFTVVGRDMKPATSRGLRALQAGRERGD